MWMSICILPSLRFRVLLVEVSQPKYMFFLGLTFGIVFALRQDEANSVEAVRGWYPEVVSDTYAVMFQTRKIAEELKSCRMRIEGISAKGVFTDDNDVARIEYFVHTLRVFEVEMLAKMGEWNEVALVVDVSDYIIRGVDDEADGVDRMLYRLASWRRALMRLSLISWYGFQSYGSYEVLIMFDCSGSRRTVRSKVRVLSIPLSLYILSI